MAGSMVMAVPVAIRPIFANLLSELSSSLNSSVANFPHYGTFVYLRRCRLLRAGLLGIGQEACTTQALPVCQLAHLLLQVHPSKPT
jgi:hypothetical protein